MAASELTGKLSTRIAQDIISGEIEAGTHIGTQQIANRYEISRTPVREALIALEKIGLLEHQQNRGYFVVINIPKSTLLLVEKQSHETQDIYHKLAEDWLTDKLPEIVTEQSLKQRYDITKSKLNELLARAAREGWAERKDGYGWRLLPVAKTAEAFNEIYRFRMAIEPAAMLEATFQINRKVLTNLRNTQEKMLQTGGANLLPERILNNGANFHEELIKMSNNPFFLTALERVNKMRRLMEYRTTIDAARVISQCSEHIEIIDFLEQGETLEASHAMRRHLNGAIKRKSPIAKDWVDNAKKSGN